jgi:3-phosphoshikimate 1-carboxyvinyltransferase
LKGGRVEVDPSRSSQFVSALLLVAPMAATEMQVVMTAPPVSRNYLTSTIEVMRAFGAEVEDAGDTFRVPATGYRSAHFEVEADASAAAYPLVAAAITGGVVAIDGIPETSTQPDPALLPVLRAMGCTVTRHPHRIVLSGPEEGLKAIDLDMNDAPDAAVAAAVACLFANGESRIRNIGNLRLKESDRLAALEAELTRVGGKARVDGDDLVIQPGPLVPTLVNTYRDHRIAMAFALVGLRQSGIVIDGPGCVSKTWPSYFDVLASL